jgi:hypothetical protein
VNFPPSQLWNAPASPSSNQGIGRSMRPGFRPNRVIRIGVAFLQHTKHTNTVQFTSFLQIRAFSGGFTAWPAMVPPGCLVPGVVTRASVDRAGAPRRCRRTDPSSKGLSHQFITACSDSSPFITVHHRLVGGGPTGQHVSPCFLHGFNMVFTCATYQNHTDYMFLGGFFLSTRAEKKKKVLGNECS